MSVKFFKGDQVFDSEVCWQGLNLLGHAQMIELDIGSRCGGYGECGSDRVRILPEDQKKLNAPRGIEREFLSEEQIAQGMRIACQCFPNQDGLRISVYLL